MKNHFEDSALNKISKLFMLLTSDEYQRKNIIQKFDLSELESIIELAFSQRVGEFLYKKRYIITTKPV